MSNSLSKFTRRNKIVKSIQFELIPEKKTRETMEVLSFEEMDNGLRELADQVAPYIDAAVRTVVNTTLSQLDFDFSVKQIDSGKKKVKDNSKKVIDNLKKVIDKQAVASIKNLYNIKISEINSAKFINDILPMHIDKMEVSAEEKIKALSLIKDLKGKTECISPFLITRITALSAWMPQRVIENMGIYEKNAVIFKKLYASKLGEEIISTLNASGLNEMANYGRYLSQDGIDAYNHIINGTFNEKGIVIKGVRQLVNEYNNKNKDASLPMPKELYKQILMPSEAAFTIGALKSDTELFDIVSKANTIALEASKNIVNEVKTAKPEDIVVPFNKLHTLSHIVVGDHSTFPATIRQNVLDALQEQLDNAVSVKDRRQITKQIDNIEKELPNKEWTLKEVIDELGQEKIAEDYRVCLTNAYLYAKSLFDEIIHPSGNIREDEAALSSLKDYFDAWTEVRQLLSVIRRKSADKGNNAFYAVLEDTLSAFRTLTKAESLCVSYITRKPKDTAKKDFATMGSASRFGSEWIRPDGILSLNRHTIVNKDGKYYYLILTPGTKPVNLLASNSKDKIFAQKKAQNAMQFIPKVSFSKAKVYFEKHPEAKECVLTEKLSRPITVTRELMDIKENNLYTTGALKDGTVTEKEYADNLFKVLSFYKEFIDAYEEYSLFDIKLKDDLHDYHDSGEFFDDINASNIAAMWLPADTKKIDEMVDKGLALMFLIHSRNLYSSKENKSAYDQLFLAAMTDASKDVFLNSNPKMFSRKATIKKPIVHKAGSILVNRTDANGERIPEDVYEELYCYYNDKGNSFITDLSKKAKDYIEDNLVVRRKATMDIVKDKRYTEDKWFVQFSFTKNRSITHGAKDLNDTIRATVNDRNIVTIIRSETDLIYYTITSPAGKVLEKRSLNVIDGHNYWDELKKTSDKRKEEKSESWKYNRKVKDQRDAYLKLAISEIVRKVVEYDAIIVLEYISNEIKNKMSAIDNQAYKTFETMLVNRLSDLYFLDVPAGEPGSVVNPYQLCDNTGNDFQNGIVFFVSPAYTGNADKNTGFINAFNLYNIGTISAKKMFLSKFDDIHYNKAKNRFVFKFDYDNFSTKFNLPNSKWTILAGGEKLIYNREKKFYTYVEEMSSSVLDILSKKNRNAEDNLAKLAFAGEMTGEEANALYDIFLTSVNGIIKAHDNAPKSYISPVTGEKTVYNENAASNLTRKFLFLQSQSGIDKAEKKEWTSCIAG